MESLLVAAQAAVPVSTERVPCHREELEAPLAVSEPAPALCGPVAGLAPAALESLLVSSVAASMAPAVYLPPFRLTASQERSVPSFDAQHLAPAVRKPAAAGPRLVTPQPIPTLTVTPPDRAMLRLESGLPRPGLLPVEFHSHRLRSAPAANPEWKSPRPALQAPRFLLRPIPEKLEDPNAHQKTARKDPGFVEILNMPAKRPPTVLMVFGRVAAIFLMACSLWFGAANIHNRQLAAREDAPPAALRFPPTRPPVPQQRPTAERRRSLHRREHWRASGKPWPTAPLSGSPKTSTAWRIGTAPRKPGPPVGRVIRMAT